MAYTDRSRLELIFGATNIAQWADVDNDEDDDKIDAKIEWAIQYRENYINDRLRDYKYTVPFTTAPGIINDITAMLSGVTLYKLPRGLVDGKDSNEQVKSIEDEAEKIIGRILAGQIKLDSVSTVSSHPGVYNYDDD